MEISVGIRINQLTLNRANLLATYSMYWDTDIDTSRIIVEPRKTPGACFLIAFIPGFFLHGLGHFYIEENKTGAILLGTEVLSISITLLGALSGVAQMDSPDKSDTPEILALTGVGLFFGSWIYDFSIAPNKLKKIQQNQVLMIYPSIEKKRALINFAFNM